MNISKLLYNFSKKENRKDRLEKNPELADKAHILEIEKWKLLRIKRPHDQVEVLIDDSDARWVDWEFIYSSGWTSRVTDVPYNFSQIERKRIPVVGNIWTCHCSNEYQFFHADYIKICLRCLVIFEKKEYTERLPYIGDILKGWRKFVELPKKNSNG